MLVAGQERTRRWPAILVLYLHSGSAGRTFRVNFGQFYKIIQYIISYVRSAPTFAFRKIVPSGLKMGADHSNISKVISNSMKYDIVQSRSGDYMGPLICCCPVMFARPVKHSFCPLFFLNAFVNLQCHCPVMFIAQSECDRAIYLFFLR